MDDAGGLAPGVNDGPHPVVSGEGLAFQIDTTARTIYGEARGEHGLDPLIAVGWTIRNRSEAKDGSGHAMWWGGTPAQVCRKRLQYSCWNDDDPNLSVIEAATLDQPRFAECYGVACLILTDDRLSDPTSKATHYYALGIPEPWWAKAMHFTVQIGNQRFFK